MPRITTPQDDDFNQLCSELAKHASQTDSSANWPKQQLALCGEYGVYEWFIPKEYGGQGWSDADLMRGYLRLSAACLTTTFIITQLTGACRRIAAFTNQTLKEELLGDLLSGKTFSTLAISHLTTSRRHLAKPALLATETDDGFVLDGFSPWVTGGLHAQTIVTGAAMDDGRQVIFAVPTDLAGITAKEPAALVGLNASHTGAVQFDQVEVSRHWLLAGPAENVMSQGKGGNTGGLQTSTLAIGLSAAAVDFVQQEAIKRPELLEPAEHLQAEYEQLHDDLFAVSEGRSEVSIEELRARANSLALRTSQAALTAAKGTGYLIGHPAGRWCREALFFLVWSCPQAVLEANLCELAGISD